MRNKSHGTHIPGFEYTPALLQTRQFMDHMVSSGYPNKLGHGGMGLGTAAATGIDTATAMHA